MKPTKPPVSKMRTPIPDPQLNPNGLHRKYIISKSDGSEIEPSAEYFVLRMDEGGDVPHVRACRKAILVYADEIQSHLPKLAEDIRARYGATLREQAKAITDEPRAEV